MPTCIIYCTRPPFPGRPSAGKRGLAQCVSDSVSCELSPVAFWIGNKMSSWLQEAKDTSCSQHVSMHLPTFFLGVWEQRNVRATLRRGKTSHLNRGSLELVSADISVNCIFMMKSHASVIRVWSFWYFYPAVLISVLDGTIYKAFGLSQISIGSCIKFIVNLLLIFEGYLTHSRVTSLDYWLYYRLCRTRLVDRAQSRYKKLIVIQKVNFLVKMTNCHPKGV